MLTSFTLTASFRMLTGALALPSPMMPTLMMLMSMRLCLNSYEKVLSRLRHRMHEYLISVRPIPLEIFLLVVFRKRGFWYVVVDQNGPSSGIGGSARGVRALDFGGLDAADAVVVVVYGCLEDCSFLLACGVPVCSDCTG